MADPHPHSPPIVLTVAGSDCSGGAGLQADLKTFAAFGAYGLSAVTCVVSEVPGKVEAVHPVPAELVESQIRLLLASLPVAAVKTGMLFSAQVVRRVAAALEAPSSGQNRPLIVDPVMIATSGDPLIEPDAIAAYEECLFPVAEIITPNLDEAAHLLGWRAREEHDLGRQAIELKARYGCGVLVKGGHLGGAEAVDCLLARQSGAIPIFLRGSFIQNVSTHGTGCTTSAAIAAGMAQGRSVEQAVRDAKWFVTSAIEGICRWGRIDALNHHFSLSPLRLPPSLP